MPRPLPGVTWIEAIVIQTGADVRDAPSAAAHLRVHLPAEQPLTVGSAVRAGWRMAPLPDGSMGYVLDEEIEPRSPR